jgi:DNA polymerase III sliding clamp (beta) subunit (PCNA family)
MIIININDLKNILKNATTLCEKKNIISVFDLIFIIKNDQMIIITEGVSGTAANLITIENQENFFCIIKTGFNIVNKIIGNITSDYLIFYPQEQGLLLIQSYDKEKKEKKKNVNMNFNIYSHNIYFENNEYHNEENFNKYKIYWDFLIKNQWENQNDTIIELEKTSDFVHFLKNISYAASTDNDRAFSNIFFQWEGHQLMANSSNRIRIAVGKIATINGATQLLKFSCDKKSISSFIKSVQNYLNEPLILRISNNNRIYSILGKNFILEMGYSLKRSINIGEFFNALENSQGFLCNSQEIKQGIQCGKSFATKFHYSILIEKTSQHVEENPNKIRFFFQEPNHGNIETYIDESFNNDNPFQAEVNVLYLWDAINVIDTKNCLIMINSHHNYLFLMPWKDGQDINNIKNEYQYAHLIMCLR